MNDVRLRWSVWPWTLHFDEDPTTGRTPLPVAGAAISDSRRGIEYRATVNESGQLDHLEVVLSGYIDDARLARLRSIPRERIESVVAAYVREQKPDEISIYLEGGLLAQERALLPKGRALYAEVARLMVSSGWGRQELAAHFLPDENQDRAVRRVDRWIEKARTYHPDIAPRAATGKGYRPNQTTDDK